MPSWNIHRKYGERLGIDEDIQGKIDEFIDNNPHHDFFDYFIEKNSTPKLNVFNGARIIIYYFYSVDFIRTNMYKKIKIYGDEGFLCFFLHVFLDIIERNTRYKKIPDIIMFKDFHSLFRSYIDLVSNFVERNYKEILEDIEKYRRKRNKAVTKIINNGMIKGRLKNANLSMLFKNMTGTVYPYGPKMIYYRKIIKERGIDYFLMQLKNLGDYETFIQNLKNNFDKFCYIKIYPSVENIIHTEYTIDEIIHNETLLKNFLTKIFKSPK